MRNFKTNLMKRKNEIALSAMALSAVMPTMIASADGASSIHGSIQKVITLLMNILTGAGAVYFAIGVFNFVTSVRNEDAERQTKSTINAFIGLALMILPQVLKYVFGSNSSSYSFDV